MPSLAQLHVGEFSENPFLCFLGMQRDELGKHSFASLPFKEGLVNLLRS